jgi:DMSO/TMAO reductase YedYZ molybdopterin-dependent catalytic subunit
MDTKTRTNRGFMGGLVGGTLYIAVSILLGLSLVTPSLPELISDRVLGLTPGSLFSAIIDQFQTAAKPIFYFLMVLTLIGVGGALGALYGRYIGPREDRSGRSRSEFGRALLFAVGLWLVEEIVILPLSGVGAFGLGGGSFTGALVRLVAFLAYGVALAATINLLRGLEEPAGDRRTLFRLGALSALGIIAAGGLVRALVSVREVGAISRVTAKNGQKLPDPITPVDQFYSISKNFIDPVVNRSTWMLNVEGNVQNTLQFTMDDLRKLTNVDQIATLNCISNEIGGDLISNGQWKGVRLGEVLSQAGVKPGSIDVVFTSADDYTDSIPVAKAMESTVLLAFEMNGEPVNDKHGGPLRAIVPNIYGMKNAKWIRKIEVVTEDYKGFWARQGWDDMAEIKTMSRIDYPLTGTELQQGDTEVSGIAFAGSRGISKVELSFDDGKTWRQVDLLPPTSPLSWVFWTTTWQADTTGPQSIQVRAYDGSGQAQIAEQTDPFPSGATGYHRISVRID